jgi:hypothetical protein
MVQAGRGGANGVRNVCELRVTVPGEPVPARLAEPLTVGIPVPPGLCPREDGIRLERIGGAGVPVDARALDRWPDGSVRWALLDFQGEASAIYRVLFDRAPASRQSAALRIDRTTDAVIAETGAGRFTIAAQGPFSVRIETTNSPASGRDVRIVARERDGHPLVAVVESVAVDTGSERATVTITGGIGEGARTVLRFSVRLHLFAGLDTLKCELTVTNPSRAAHAGGIWELGDPRSVLLKELSVRVASPGLTRAWCSPESGLPALEVGTDFELYQDSSGGDRWRSSVHVNRDGVVPMTFKGYRLKSGAEEHYGLRATPLVWAESAAGITAVGMPYFWQNCPKCVACDPDGLVLSLFPSQYGDLHEIQGGEQKTHVFSLAFTQAASTEALEWLRRPAMAAPNPQWYADARAVPYLTPAASDPHADYLRLVSAAIDGPESLERKRELIDEYGWRNFGDIYADHEAVLHTGPEPLVSHYNNQYDAIAGLAYQFMRSGNSRWWTAMDELASHVVDIDIYHTTEDKSAYDNGLFWHTVHYCDAGRSSHRSFPKAPGVYGGGPSNEHVYSTGLLLHFLMTGNEGSRAAALGLAEWAYRIDDGRLTVFKWLSHGDTGLASSTASADYHGPGRGAGNVIGVLLNGYRLAGDRKYLDKAEALIRRCINPADDVAARDLLDAERRWSYTVFLQVLGRYLGEKALVGQFDEMYAYARASLLLYARWMAVREYPYLDKPQILEYPNETWAAQDMRKSDVFKYAALYAEGQERASFLERADFFFRTSISQLSASPTRTLARPLVLLMSYGFMHAAFHANRDRLAILPAPTVGGFPAPVSFVSQKATAIKRARTAIKAGGAGALLLVVIVCLRLLGVM